MQRIDGTVLADRYLLEKRIASGGMGTVFAALDERLGRKVAIKLLNDHQVNDDRSVERFRREARSVATLTHVSIAHVYDYCEDHGRHLIVMELVEGRDLAAILESVGALAPQRACRIAAQVCDALAHAHEKGIVHRDVKPANILVDKADRVKVTDFGIARAAGDATLTATGSFFGTPNYIAPEIAQGGEATPRSDIYSAGVVLFEMLTGEPPFQAQSPVALAMNHVSGEVPLPSSRKPGMPYELDAVTRKATAKVPEDRFVGAAALAAELRAASATARSSPRRPTRTLPLRENTRATTAIEDTSGKVRAAMTGSTLPRRLRGTPLVYFLGASLVVAVLVAGIIFLRGSEDPGRASRGASRNAGKRQPGGSSGELPSLLKRALDDLEKEIRS